MKTETLKENKTGIGLGTPGGAMGGVGEKVNVVEEDHYWRAMYITRSYVDDSSPYETYQPAYRTGFEGYRKNQGKTWDEVEEGLRHDYENVGGTIGLQWEQAKAAAKDAWERLENRFKQKKLQKQPA